MKIGASSACFYPMQTELAVNLLSEIGVKAIEIFFNAMEELDGKIFEGIAATLKKNCMSVVSVHPYQSGFESMYLFSNYSRRTDELLELYKRYFEMMNRLSAKVFVLHGAFSDWSVSDEVYFERYLALREVGKPFGVTVAQENVAYCKSGSFDFLKKMSKQLGDDVSIVLDLKQARRSGLDIFEMIEAFGKKIVHSHISDANEKHTCLPIGEGSFNFMPFMKALQKLNYDGAAVVELYNDCFDDPQDIGVSVKKLQDIEENC